MQANETSRAKAISEHQECDAISCGTVEFVEVPMSDYLGAYKILIRPNKPMYFVFDDLRRSNEDADWAVVKAYIDERHPEACRNAEEIAQWNAGLKVDNWFTDLTIGDFAERFSSEYDSMTQHELDYAIRATAFKNALLRFALARPDELQGSSLAEMRSNKHVGAIAAGLGIVGNRSEIWLDKTKSVHEILAQRMAASNKGHFPVSQDGLCRIETDMNYHQEVLDRIASEYSAILDEENCVINGVHDYSSDEWELWEESQITLRAIRQTCSNLGVPIFRDGGGLWRLRDDSRYGTPSKTVLARNGERALLFTNPTLPLPYVVTDNYSDLTGEWNHGTYHSSLPDAMKDLAVAPKDALKDSSLFESTLSQAEALAAEKRANSRADQITRHEATRT